MSNGSEAYETRGRFGQLWIGRDCVGVVRASGWDPHYTHCYRISYRAYRQLWLEAPRHPKPGSKSPDGRLICNNARWHKGQWFSHVSEGVIVERS